MPSCYIQLTVAKLTISIIITYILKHEYEILETYLEPDRRWKEEEMNTGFNLLRSSLESEQKRLVEELKQLEASSHPTEERREGSPFGKREEEATETLELENRLALEKRIKSQLAEVEHALYKFEEGTYGLCDSCGNPIDPARLEALPQANLCLDCKARQAKNGKGKLPIG
jgi:RNA polymerase-binding protein DksA